MAGDTLTRTPSDLIYPLRPQRGWYWLGASATALVATLLTRWHVEGSEHIPRSGPLIVVANHFSFVDPPLLAASLPRQLSYLGKVELTANPIGRAFCKAIGIIPLRRGAADRQALRTALGALELGGVLGVFPEGTRGREHPRVLKPGRNGVALLARMSGAPLIPVGIAGTDAIDKPSDLGTKLLRRPEFTVRIGPAFTLPDRAGKDDLEALTHYIMAHIARLLPERYRGEYANAMES